MRRQSIFRAVVVSAMALCALGCGAGDVDGQLAGEEPTADFDQETVDRELDDVTNALTAGGYAAAVLSDSPAAYWRLRETSGTTATDSTGVSHGQYVAGVKLGQSGAVFGDSAVSFDGYDDVVSVRDHAKLRLNGSFSLEFWAKLNAERTSFPGVTSKGTGGNGFVVYWRNGERRLTFKRAGIDGKSTSVAGALRSDRFQHYVLSYDAPSKTLRWYVNGVLDATHGSVTYPTNYDASPFVIGRGDGGQFGNQTIDDFAVYNKALSADRVKAHFATTQEAPAPTPTDAGATPTPDAGTPPPPPPPPTPTPTPVPTTKFVVGACAYGSTDFARFKAMGMKHVRMDRPTAQTIELARTYGIEVLPIADYGYPDLSGVNDWLVPPKPENYGIWAKRIVDLYRGMQNPPKVFEVWNEPWLTQFWKPTPDPVAYLGLVKAFAKEAWAVWPNATILVSADDGFADQAPFRKGMLAADTTKFLADPRILPATHNYSNERGPSQVTTRPCDWDFNRYDCAFRDYKNHGHPNPQVWVTEYGWETTEGGSHADFGATSEQNQASFTIEALDMMRRSGKVVAAYGFMLKSNDSWGYNWLRPDNSERPVVGAVRSYISTHGL